MGIATGVRRNPAVREVVVVGGGPAGAATALLLAQRGRDVVLVEASRYGEPRFGETLPPEINPLLRELGVWDAFVRSGPLASPGLVSAWGSPHPQETHFIANLHGSGWHVDRNVFDHVLSDAAAAAGAEIVAGASALRCTPDGDAWRVALSGDRERPLRARFVVDAGGRNGTRLGEVAREVDDRLLAIFLRLAFDADPPRDTRTLIESAPDGWWYCAPLPSGETAAVLFVDPGQYVRDGFEIAEQLASAPLTCERVGRARIAASHVVHVPSSIRRRAAGKGWAAVGDAAASYDPLSGFGIVKALQSARAFADALDDDSLAAYDADVRRRFDAYVAQRRAYYDLERRWPDRPFWRVRFTEAAIDGRSDSRTR
ncbi:MAG: lodB [Candidatus Eremiobacteraeota bacterium]|nr:lodB [Candidatus Eremiobacteraeota bacterium]